jgi:hypothetical protein
MRPNSAACASFGMARLSRNPFVSLETHHDGQISAAPRAQ